MKDFDRWWIDYIEHCESNECGYASKDHYLDYYEEGLTVEEAFMEELSCYDPGDYE